MPDYSFQQAGAPLALGPARSATHLSPSWVGPYYASDGSHVWHLNGHPNVQYARPSDSLPKLLTTYWLRRDVLPIPPAFIFPEPQQSDYPSYQAWKAAWMNWKAHQNENAAYAAAQFGPWTVVCSAALNDRVWTCPYRGTVYPPIQPQPSWYAQSVGQDGSFQQAGAPLALGPAQISAHCAPGYVPSPFVYGPRCLPLPPAVRRDHQFYAVAWPQPAHQFYAVAWPQPKPADWCPPGWHYDPYVEQCVLDGSPKGY